MTVKELKKKLEEYDDDLTVCFEYDAGCACGLVESIKLDKFIDEKILVLAEEG